MEVVHVFDIYQKLAVVQGPYMELPYSILYMEHSFSGDWQNSFKISTWCLGD